MSKIAIAGIGNTGQILTESLQDKMPDAAFAVVNHFETGKSSTVANRINTRLKRKLTGEEISKHEEYISKINDLEWPGDSYWWYASKFGRPAYYNHLLHMGIALVRDEVIVTCIRTSVNVGSFVLYKQNPLERFEASSGQ